MTDSTGTTTRTYYELKRVKTKTVPGAETITFLYDITTDLPAGQVAETETDPKGNATTKVFDQAGRMIEVTADGQTTTYEYYENGVKHLVLYPNGANEEYIYYDNWLLRAVLNRSDEETLIGAYTYTYDELNRLETVTEPNGKITTYTFDQAGNRLTQIEQYEEELTTTTYTYNEQNRLTDKLTISNGQVIPEYLYVFHLSMENFVQECIPKL